MCGSPDSRQVSNSRPQVVSNLATHYIVQIAAGAEHMVVLTSEQEVYSWGVNSEGQVCVFTVISVTLLVKVTGLKLNPLLFYYLKITRIKLN